MWNTLVWTGQHTDPSGLSGRELGQISGRLNLYIYPTGRFIGLWVQKVNTKHVDVFGKCSSLCVVRRSTSSRTMSVGASPRTGTLNSRDVQHSQLANMSSGSQVISASPPPVPLSSLAFSSHQPSHAAVRPVCSSPPRHQSASSSSPYQLSPRELSPLSLSLMSSSLVSPTVTVSASDMHGHHTPSPAGAAALSLSHTLFISVITAVRPMFLIFSHQKLR